MNPSSPPPPAHTEPSLPPPAPLSATSQSFAGTKRPAPSLLPAFEPLSSSPGFPRPAKRQALGSPARHSSAYLKYPTPIPTSSTGILSSSPPGLQRTRPGLARTLSTLSERAPLSAVPSVELNENGDALLMGRSSNSSHYQLTANRLVSRVHVKARYIAAASVAEPSKIEIVCNGWNGLKLHCQGRTYELWKGDSFTSETEGSEIMLDVQDARVMIQWPKKDSANLSDSSWDDSPRSRTGGASSSLLPSSPLRRTTRIKSPESPTPVHMSSSQRLQALMPDSDSDGRGAVEIYEDPSADEQDLPKPSVEDQDPGASHVTEMANSFSSDLSDPESDPDEENDPIVHSFGPFGANITNRLASITASSPKYPSPRSRRPAASPSSRGSAAAVAASAKLASETLSPVPEVAAPIDPLEGIDVLAVTNHVANQLAFSRLSSRPLSSILSDLPAQERAELSKEQLRQILESTACIGTITRQGKDAAGRPLESEFYYVPEGDTDEDRRAAVVDGLRRPSLRNCRKQHKQYYWKRPRTP